MHGSWLKIEIILQNAAHPYARGNLIFRQADFLSREIRRAGNSTVGANVHARMTKQPRDKRRDGNVFVLATRYHHRVTAERHLGDVELLEAKSALECFLGLHRNPDNVPPFHRETPTQHPTGTALNPNP